MRQIPGATLQITTPTGIEMVAQGVVKSELNDNDFIIPKQYKQIDKANSPLEKNKQIGDNLFLYQDDKTGLYGLQDENQKKITPAQYLDFGTSQNGICLVQHSNKKFGAMDLLGNAIIPFEYDYIMNDADSNQFIVGIDEKYGVMNRKAKPCSQYSMNIFRF